MLRKTIAPGLYGIGMGHIIIAVVLYVIQVPDYGVRFSLIGLAFLAVASFVDLIVLKSKEDK